MPLITHLWTQTFGALSSGLEPNQSTPCSYDRDQYRYCVQLKTELKASGSSYVLRPSIRFRLRASCGVGTGLAEVAAIISVSEFDGARDAVGRKLVELPLFDDSGRAAARCVGGWLEGTTQNLATSIGFGDSLPIFVVASVTNRGRKRLGTLSLDALYAGDGKLHRRSRDSQTTWSAEVQR